MFCVGLGAVFTGFLAIMSLLLGLLVQAIKAATVAHNAEATIIRVEILLVFIGDKVNANSRQYKMKSLFF